MEKNCTRETSIDISGVEAISMIEREVKASATVSPSFLDQNTAARMMMTGVKVLQKVAVVWS